MNDVTQSYAVLGINHTASPELIKQTYRKLAKVWHPDRYTHDPALKAQAEVEIKKINQAYATIKAYQAENKHEINLNASHTAESKVTKSHPPHVYYQQGVSYAEVGNYGNALASFAQAIKLDPNYLEAYQYRGFVLSKLGFKLRADAEFKKAHQIKLKHKSSPSYEQYTPSAYNYQHTNSERVQSPTQTTVKTTTEQFLKFWHTIIGFEQPVRCLAINSNNQIASVSEDREINLWQVNTGQRISTLQGHTDKITCLAISFSGQTLISGSRDQTIRFWDLKEKKNIRTLGSNFSGYLDQVVALGLTPDNQTLISCGADNSLKIWDVNRAREILNISLAAAVTCLAVSPDGQLFCSGGLEPQLRIRHTKNGQVIRSINNNTGVLSLAFSPDGNLLATGGFNRSIKLWDLTTGKEIYTLTGHSDRVTTVIFSKDGKTLISSSWDQTIKFWQLSTGKEIASVVAHSSKIHSVALSADDQILVSGSSDRTIKLWRCNF